MRVDRNESDELVTKYINIYQGKILVQLRKKKFITRKYIADQLNKSEDQLKSVEKGESSLSPLLLFKLSYMFKIPYESLFPDVSKACKYVENNRKI